MAAQHGRKFQPYMKPVAKKVTIQKPEWKSPVSRVLPDGFIVISDSRVRKVYK